jgi:hypothetical protein
MALTHPRSTGRWWSWLHFLIRVAGLTGLFAAAVGLVLAGPEAVSGWVERLAAGDRSLPGPEVLAVAVGVALAALFLVVEIATVLRTLAGRRGAFGSNVAVQVLLAAALLAAVNGFSFGHYRRFDWTNDARFTLPADVRRQMTRLRGDTTIVVYQRHKLFGQLSDKPDVYDFAAERKVVEKVRDLVDQFRELGPQFHVEVLDVEEEGFGDKLDRIDREAPALREAIDQAAENSLLFFADGRVQRLGFHDVYELDKKASQEADGGRGNLVLLDQGVKPFADKILNVDEKRPRVAVAVIHELLSMEGSNEVGMDLGMRGVKKALASRGIDARDVILKKWNEFTGPEPAVLTYGENKYERLEEQIAELDAAVQTMEGEQKRLREVLEIFQKDSLEDLTKRFSDQLRGRPFTEELRRQQIAVRQPQAVILELELNSAREERSALATEKAGLSVESLAEQRRITDLKAKTERMLAECDLLVIPRLTLLNVARGDLIPNRVYRLDDAQVAAIKDFLKAGKPVLAMLGPPNEPRERAMMDPQAGGPDKLEDLFGELGFSLPKQAVLFNVESKSFAERRGGLLIMGASVEVPPVRFDWPPGAGRPSARELTAAENLPPNPIRESMRLTTQGAGRDGGSDLRLRHPRPVYYEPKEKHEPFDPVFLMTDPASWNEDQPFPTRERTPRFEPPKDSDPAKATVEEKRRGPFPIGVAAEVAVPAAWSAGSTSQPGTARVAVIGHGGIFVGSSLSPVKEKLLLDTCNWLLGRDELLTKDEARWQYPRTALTEKQQKLWQWGGRLGLPLAFAYLGLVVLLVRRLR